MNIRPNRDDNDHVSSVIYRREAPVGVCSGRYSARQLTLGIEYMVSKRLL
jgi:hypothetical protein